MSLPSQECKNPSSFEALLFEKINEWPVCQIAFNEDSNRGGTGFLIAPGVVMTCSHVIPNKETAGKTHLIFHTLSGTHRVKLVPDVLFHTSPSPGEGKFSEKDKLDYTIVALAMDDLPPEIAKMQKEIKSIFEEHVTGPAMTDMQRVSIVHYPSLPGETKKRVLGFNAFEVKHRDAYNLYHRISTEGGSSGAPLFDQEGRLIGVHRMGKKGDSLGCATPIEQILVSLEILRETIEGRVIIAPTIPDHMQLADPYDHFTNRTREMEAIHEHLERDHKITLYGPGGIGKSELALQYANNHLENYWLIWTFASATPESLERDYRVLALKLKVPVEERDTISMVIQKVHVWLNREQAKPWLLIYDDFDREFEHLKQFQLPSTRQGHLILTSHGSKSAEHSLEVEPFSQEHSRELITKITQEKPSASMDELIELCGFYPLTLSRASLYIKRLGSIAKYLKKFPQKEALLKRPADERYQKTFEEIIQQTLNLLPQKAQDWVKVCSCLKATRISISYLKTWLELSYPEEAVELKEDLLMTLSEHVVQRKQGKQLVMHRLFADALSRVENQKVIDRACDLLIKQINWDFDEKRNYQNDLIRALEWKDFALALMEHEHFKKLEEEKRASIFFHFGEVLRENYELLDALRYYEKALRILLKMYGEEHPDVALSLNNIASCYHDQGKIEEALKETEKALRIRLKVYGEEHPSVASSLNDIAVCHREQGKIEEALKETEKALRIRLKVYGEEHPDVAFSLNNIASCYIAQGKIEEALKETEKALRIRLKVYGEEHPEVALSLNNIASCYHDQGKIEEALKETEKALRIRLKVYGEEHPDVASSLNNIAVCYHDQGKIEEALKEMEKALRIWLKVYGEGHPDVAISFDNIAVCYRAQGKLEEALKEHEKALRIWKKVYGEGHPRVALSLNNIGKCYKNMGNQEKAEECFQRSKNIEVSQAIT